MTLVVLFVKQPRLDSDKNNEFVSNISDNEDISSNSSQQEGMCGDKTDI